MLETLVAKYHDQDHICRGTPPPGMRRKHSSRGSTRSTRSASIQHRPPVARVELERCPIPECYRVRLQRAVIHNSDYVSVNECKRAIDRYFLERNAAFAKNPRRAGNVIWGTERETVHLQRGK